MRLFICTSLHTPYVFNVFKVLLYWYFIALANRPEEAGYFEGDIVNGELRLKSSRNGIIGEEYRWPKVGDHFEIPYIIDEGSLSKLINMTKD